MRFTVPNSGGPRRLREFNPCHRPPGEGGGQFAPKGDCGGQVGSPRERTPKGQERDDLYTTARRRYMRLRWALKLDDHANPTEEEMREFLAELPTLIDLRGGGGLTPQQKDDFEHERVALRNNLDTLQYGIGAYSTPDKSDKAGSGADVRERLMALMPLRREVLDAKLADKEAIDAYDATSDEWFDLRDSMKNAKVDGKVIELPRYPLGLEGRREPLDDGDSLHRWLNDPEADAGEREERAELLDRYEDMAKKRQALNANIKVADNAWIAAEKTYRAAVRGVLQIPESERIRPIQIIPNGAEATALLKDRAKDFADATEFLVSITSTAHIKFPTATLLKPATGQYEGRSYASSVDNSINMEARASTAIIAHELTHHIEFNNKDVLQAAMDFRDARVQTDKEVKLSSLVPGSGYKDHELAYATSKRVFPDAYSGKIYPEYSAGRTIAYNFRGRPEGATEVLTMGVQHLYEDPMKFAQSDPDFFDFTIDVLRNGAKFAMRHVKDRVPARRDNIYASRITW